MIQNTTETIILFRRRVEMSQHRPNRLVWIYGEIAGPSQYIFGRQGRHSGGHFIGEPPLPPLFSIFQNPAKDQALAALPPVAALLL